MIFIDGGGEGGLSDPPEPLLDPPLKTSVLLMGYRQTVQTQIRPQNAASDQGLHCLLTDNYNKFWIKKKNSTQ